MNDVNMGTSVPNTTVVISLKFTGYFGTSRIRDLDNPLFAETMAKGTY